MLIIKILIANNYADVHEGLKNMDLCGEASDGREVLQLMRSQNWDIVLLDVSMPGKNGLDVLNAIRADKPELRILILSIYAESQYALRSQGGRFRIFNQGKRAWPTARRYSESTTQGGKYISAELAEKLASEFAAPSERLLHETLSDRELDILRLMAAGNIPAQIAEKLFISSKTVSTYRARLLCKMNMHSNAELISYAIKNNLIY